MRIGLVLAAGGSVGVAYHGGVLSALQARTGWDPRSAEVMVGTSAGSVTAAVLRAGVPAPDLAAISEDRPLSAEGARLAAMGRPHRPRPRPADALSFRPVTDIGAVIRGLGRPWAIDPKAVLLNALPAGGIPTAPLAEGIDALYGGRWPERDLWICAYDLTAGRREVFGRPGAPAASVGSAVAASAAIPMYFSPVRIGERAYVDGGVHSMINLDLLAGRDLDLVIAVSPLSTAVPWALPGPATLLRQALRRRLGAEVAALRRTGVAVVAIQPGRTITSSMGLNPMDAARRAAVSTATRDGMRRWLAENPDGRRLAGILREAASGPPAASA